ncbi:MAG: trypsin-like serine protease [Streptosporangiales bacterium]|nr:trypsin-like serine protease [Streptosporangiales bacterium]
MPRFGLGDPRGPDFVPPPPGIGPPPEMRDEQWPAPPPAAVPAPSTETPRPRGRLGRVLAAAVLVATLTGGTAGFAGTRLAQQDPSSALPQSSAGPANGTGDLSGTAARVQPAVVSVEVRGVRSRATGSGFVIDTRGHVLTNAHVVDGGGDVTVVLSDRRRLDAEVVGTDEANDVAVLAVDASRSPAPIVLGRSADVRVGDPVLAVGSPLGLAGTVTGGIVSALDREVPLGGGQEAVVVQTDASINPGNSGGPLVNARGEVVGVNTAMLTRGGSGSIGIGFAIPVDRAADVAQRIIRTR